MRRIVLSILAVSGSILLSACDKTPTGQVAAVVDGEEITLQEINGELATMNLPSGVDPEAAQQIALQRVIDRRLLARTAREEGLDQTPEFFIRQRQLIDNMLIDSYRDKLQRGVSVPSDADISAYANENPEAFANRKLLRVDQISFETNASNNLTALKDDRSMADVAETLDRLGIEYRRSEAELDTGMLGSQRMKQIRALPSSEPFILPGPRVTTVAVILSERDAMLDAGARDAQVVERMKRQQLADLLNDRLEAAKASAQIEYQEGFGPDAKAATDADSTSDT